MLSDGVRIVGTGLMGASIGLALRKAGVPVTLADISPTARALARDLGAGELAAPQSPVLEPGLVVVAIPPDVTARVVAAELRAWPQATVTDVASVKSVILHELTGQIEPIHTSSSAAAAAGGHPVRLPPLTDEQLARYVGAHPMAGRERSGAIAAKADLFEGRPWVITPHPDSAPASVALVEELARQVGAQVTLMDPDEHDEAVAAVSHVPQVAASLVASRLRDLPTRSVGLAGSGLRDVIRIAASDPAMWTAILTGNATAVSQVLQDLMADLAGVIEALSVLGAPTEHDIGAREVLARLVSNGNAGYARIPGKHGASPTTYAVVTVVIPDTPGSLGRLLVTVGEEGVNLEDLHLEHNLGKLTGIVEISVVPAAADPLRAALRSRGWTVQD